MEVDPGLIIYKSKIDPDYMVFVIYEEHHLYSSISEEMSKMKTICVMDTSTNFMIIDGEAMGDLSMDHLLCIESHEIAHAMLDQSELTEEQAEIESDLVGIFLLKTLNFNDASLILERRLYNLRGVEYSKLTLLETVGEERMKKIIDKLAE